MKSPLPSDVIFPDEMSVPPFTMMLPLSPVLFPTTVSVPAPALLKPLVPAIPATAVVPIVAFASAAITGLPTVPSSVIVFAAVSSVEYPPVVKVSPFTMSGALKVTTPPVLCPAKNTTSAKVTVGTSTGETPSQNRGATASYVPAPPRPKPVEMDCPGSTIPLLSHQKFVALVKAAVMADTASTAMDPARAEGFRNRCAHSFSLRVLRRLRRFIFMRSREGIGGEFRRGK